jgi:hypothetical protein
MQRKSGYLLAAIMLASTSCAQPIVKLPVPLALSECEYFTNAPPCRLGMGNKAAGIWTFDGSQGKAVWMDPSAIVQLSIQRFDTGAVIINRRDPASGLTAVYTGTIQGNTMSGMENWRLPNGYSGQSKWYAQIGSAQEQQAEMAQQHQAEQQILAAQQRPQYSGSSAGMGGLGALFMGLAGAAAMTPGNGGGDYDNGPSEREQDEARQRDIRRYDSRNPQNAY